MFINSDDAKMTTWECSVCWQVIEEHRKADIRKHRISHIRENDWAKLEKSVSRSKTQHWLNEQTEQPTALTTSAQNSIGDSPCTSFESPGSNFSVDESSPDRSQKKTGSKLESPFPTPESSKPRRSLYKCDFCDFKGKRDGIVRHVKFDHKEKLDKWRTKQSDVLHLPCDQCDRFFASMDDRDAHFKMKHLKPESLIRGTPGGTKRQASEMKDTRNMSPADSVRLFVRKKLEKRDSRSKSKTRESLLNLCKEYTSGTSDSNAKEPEGQKVDVILTCPSSRAEAFFSGRLSFCPYHPCEATFKTSLALEAHVSRKHNDKWDHFMRSLDRPYQCPSCSWRYSSSQSLREHLRKYKKICASYKPTSECTRELLFEESSLKAGEELAENPADLRPYIVDDLIDRNRRLCPFNEHFHCQFRFSSEEKLADHIQKWHPTHFATFMRCIDRPFICETCDFRFPDIDQLRLHKQMRQGVCSSYSRDLHDVYIRKRPRSDDNMESDDNYSEYDPDKIFEDPLLLETASIKEEPDPVRDSDEFKEEAKPVAEPEKNSQKLLKIKVKTYSEMIHCPYCEVIYNLDEDSRALYKLIFHVSAHHPQLNAAFRRKKTTFLPYQCDICRFCFVDRDQLAEHDCEKSLDVPQIIEVICEHCGARLCSEPRYCKDMIDTHMKNRHRDRYLQFRSKRSEYFNLKCPGCLFYFSSEKALDRHEENCRHPSNLPLLDPTGDTL